MTIRFHKTIETPQQLRRAIAVLSPDHPITDRFSAQWRRAGKQETGPREKRKVWYSSQHEHWLGWLENYSGPGAYDRKNWNRTAEYVYIHIVNPQMLIYLAEATKVDRALLREAVKAALAKPVTMSSMSSAIRRVIPWSIIEPELCAY